MDWIDAAVVLPEEHERVLLFTPYNFFGSDHLCIGNKESITVCTTRIHCSKVPVFTHWMPLPAVPGNSSHICN